MNETRVCTRCKKEKPLEDFRNRINRRTEFGTLCSTCKSYVNRRYRKDYAAGYHKHYHEQREYRLQLLATDVPEGQRRCRSCLKAKAEAEFVIEPRYRTRVRGAHSNYCAECRDYRKKFARLRRSQWSPEKKARETARLKTIRDARKKLVIERYGGKCVCCGEHFIELLTIDHIVKIGSKKRKEIGDWGGNFYLKIIRLNFPPDYRCLCWSCNWSFGCYGYCPHQQSKSELN